MKQLGMGAEAVIFKGKNIIKNRVKKGYRLDELDKKIRKSRTRREAKVIEALRSAEIPVPRLLKCDDKKMVIEMEFIDDQKIRDVLNTKNCKTIGKEIGRIVALIHNQGIIHGDLTTSNMILKGRNIFFIDFGLSFFSEKTEDKAVDLHLLRQALESKHTKIWEKCFKAVLQGYKVAKDYNKILKRFEVVEQRGRNKAKF
ncbi:Kae1-associated serine/threonine protein kinase [Candidatus Woesearchaeota archaeon]|nr:MAG: Kae1-associated serine/threonine protein kinase [Candidatus Woesearchaeota archaeon]